MPDNTPETQALEPVEVTQAARDAADEHYPPHLWRKEARDDLAKFLARFERDTIERHRQSSSNAGGVDVEAEIERLMNGLRHEFLVDADAVDGVEHMVRLSMRRLASLSTPTAEPMGDALTPSALSGDAGEGAIADIAAERRRQVETEGWTADHDDEHDDGELSRAAACYAAHASAFQRVTVNLAAYQSADTMHSEYGWPWSSSWWKPSTPRRDLVKAGALIVAEIERIDRAALPSHQGAGE